MEKKMNQIKTKKVKEFLNKLDNLENLGGKKSAKDSKAVETFVNRLLAENMNINYYRLMSKEEKSVLSQEAFDFLMSLVKSRKIKFEHVEQFINQLLTFRSQLSNPIDLYTMSTILEMISFTNFQNTVIDQVIELYINSPELIKSLRHSIH